MLHLVFIYSELLHRLSTLEESYQMFNIGTITVLIETVILFVVVAVIKNAAGGTIQDSNTAK